MSNLLSNIARVAAVTFMLSSLPMPSSASRIIVTVEGGSSDKGAIGCSLFTNDSDLQSAGDKPPQISLVPVNGSVVCEFEDVQAGTYAIAAAHDENANGKLDYNFLGAPKEAWGVSKNVRFRFRPTRFDEASFEVEDDKVVEMTIKLN